MSNNKNIQDYSQEMVDCKEQQENYQRFENLDVINLEEDERNIIKEWEKYLSNKYGKELSFYIDIDKDKNYRNKSSSEENQVNDGLLKSAIILNKSLLFKNHLQQSVSISYGISSQQLQPLTESILMKLQKFNTQFKDKNIEINNHLVIVPCKIAKIWMLFLLQITLGNQNIKMYSFGPTRPEGIKNDMIPFEDLSTYLQQHEIKSQQLQGFLSQLQEQKYEEKDIQHYINNTITKGQVFLNEDTTQQPLDQSTNSENSFEPLTMNLNNKDHHVELAMQINDNLKDVYDNSQTILNGSKSFVVNQDFTNQKESSLQLENNNRELQNSNNKLKQEFLSNGDAFNNHILQQIAKKRYMISPDDKIIEDKIKTITTELKDIAYQPIKVFDIKNVLSLQDVLQILETILSENGSFAHIILDNGEHDSIFSETIEEQQQATNKISKLIDPNSKILTKPVIIISIINKDNICAGVLLPHYYKAINGNLLLNEKVIFYFLDALSGSRSIEKSIPQNVFKYQLGVWGNKEKIIIDFPSIADQESEVTLNSRNIISQSNNSSDSGWWCIYNIIMILYSGSDNFLKTFTEEDRNILDRLKTILSSQVKITADAKPYKIKISQQDIIQFKKTNNSIFKDYEEKVKSSNAKIEQLKQSSADETKKKLINDQKILQEQSDLMEEKISFLEEQIVEIKQAIQHEQCNSFDDKEILNKYLSGEIKEMIENDLEQKKDKLKQGLLKHNEKERNDFINIDILQYTNQKQDCITKYKELKSKIKSIQVEINSFENQSNQSKKKLNETVQQEQECKEQRNSDRLQLKKLQINLNDINNFRKENYQELIKKLSFFTFDNIESPNRISSSLNVCDKNINAQKSQISDKKKKIVDYENKIEKIQIERQQIKQKIQEDTQQTSECDQTILKYSYSQVNGKQKESFFTIITMNYFNYDSEFGKWDQAAKQKKLLEFSIQQQQKKIYQKEEIKKNLQEFIKDEMEQIKSLENQTQSQEREKQKHLQNLWNKRDECCKKLDKEKKDISEKIIKKNEQMEKLKSDQVQEEGNISEFKKKISQKQKEIDQIQTSLQVQTEQYKRIKEVIAELMGKLKYTLQTDNDTNNQSNTLNDIQEDIKFDIDLPLNNDQENKNTLKKKMDEYNQQCQDLKMTKNKLTKEIDSIGKKIEEIEEDTNRLDNIERENILQQSIKVRMNRYKEINIHASYLTLSSHTKINETQLDNLISCLLQSIVDNEKEMDSKSQNESILKLKRLLCLEQDTKITQEIVNQIINRIEEVYSKEIDNRYILLENIEEQKQLSKIIYLYENESNYETLTPYFEIKNVTKHANMIINYFIYREILLDLCSSQYKQVSQKEISELEIEQLYRVYKKLEKDMLEIGEDPLKFIEYINTSRNEKYTNQSVRFEDKLLIKIAQNLMELYKQTDNNSQEQKSINYEILKLRQRYMETLGFIIQQEGERRKKPLENRNDFRKLITTVTEEETKKEIKDLEEKIQQKKDELEQKTKEIDQIITQISQVQKYQDREKQKMNENFEKISEKQQELDQKYLEKQYDVENQQKSVNQTKTNIDQREKEKLQLIEGREKLENKVSELKETLQLKEDEKKRIENQCDEYEKQNDQRKSDKDQLEKQKKCTQALIEFFEGIYKEFNENEQLYRMRMSIHNRLKNTSTLAEKYEILIGEKYLDKYANDLVKEKFLQNNDKIEEEFDSCFNQIFSHPIITKSINKSGQKEFEVLGFNLVYEEVEKLLEDTVEKELKNSSLSIETGGFLKTTSEDITFDQYLSGKQNISDDLLDLIDRKLKINYIFEEKTLSHIGKLTSDSVIAQQVKFHQLKAQTVFDQLKITYPEILKTCAKTIKLISGNNIYVKANKIELPGINLALVAKNNIYIPKEFEIDVAGQDGAAFSKTACQAFGNVKVADKLKSGRNGEDGFDGLCGSNGGNIYISAENEIMNFKFIKQIKSSGGKGADGQQGGIGQKGGVGQDLGDAEAEIPSICIINPCFSAAFARIPGLDPTTGEFSVISELSGDGGNAGKAGFGGDGGYEGDVTIKDRDKWIKYTKMNGLQKSDNLSIRDDIIVDNISDKGSDAKLGIQGGDAGEPGTYGCDHVIYVSGLMSKRENRKGDYSNFLREPSVCQNGEIYSTENSSSNYKEGGIQDTPDLYAKRSTSFTVFSSILTGALTIAATYNLYPIISAATSVIPVIGIQNWAIGFLAVGKVVTGSIIALSGASSFFAYKTLKGTEIQIGVPDNKKKKNRFQIQFHNRYCDYPPLRDQNQTLENLRIDQRSCGRKGEDSKQKEEKERDDHSRAEDKINEFNNEYEIAKLTNQSTKASKDIKKHKFIENQKRELKSNEELSTINNTKIEQIDIEQNTLKSYLETINKEIDKNVKDISEISIKIKDMKLIEQDQEKILINEETQLMNGIDKYLTDIDALQTVQIEKEFNNIDKNCASELFQQFKAKSNEIEIFLYQKKIQIETDSKKSQANLDENIREIQSKKEEIEMLQSKHLNTIERKISNEKKIEAIEEFQRKVEKDMKDNNQKQFKEKIMINKRFEEVKANDKNTNCLSNDDRIQIDELKRLLIQKLLRSFTYPKLVKIITKKIIKREQLNTYLGKLDIILKSNENNSQKQDNVQKLLNNSIECIHSLYENQVQSIIEAKSKNQLKNTEEEITQENFIYLCGLDVHYETKSDEHDEELESSEQKQKLENSDFTDLEYEMFNFFQHKDFVQHGEVSIENAIILVYQYHRKVMQISKLEYPITNILSGNVDRFYEYLILYIKKTISDNIKQIWSYINQIIYLMEQVNLNLNAMKNEKLWEQLNIVHKSIELKNKYFNEDLSQMKTLINELNQKGKESERYKREIITDYLQPILIGTLIKNEKIDDYQTQKEKIFSSQINSLEEKDQIMKEIKQKQNSDKTESRGISHQGFIDKFNIPRDKLPEKLSTLYLMNLIFNNQSD